MSSWEISTFESHELICSRAGGVAWDCNCSIKSEKLKELPSGGLLVIGVSVLIDVDNGWTPSRTFIFVSGVVSQAAVLMTMRRSRTLVPVAPVTTKSFRRSKKEYESLQARKS